MTLNEALRTAHERLSKIGPYPELAWKEAECLLGFALGKERTWLIAHGQEPLMAKVEQYFFSLVERRSEQEPIAYLIGTAEFCGQSFFVNKHVLIPRRETEELVTHAARYLSSAPAQTMIWDVGTGSGAIAITIQKRFPHLPVIASDTSKRALVVAQKNAEQLLDEAQHPLFLQGSLLAPTIQKQLTASHSAHVLVLANLPYLPWSDTKVLQKEIVDYEPSAALFAEQDGNALILKLVKQLSAFIKKRSLSLTAYLEFDPPQATRLKEKIQILFPEASVTIHRDVCGRERFLEIIFPRPQTKYRPL